LFAGRHSIGPFRTVLCSHHDPNDRLARLLELDRPAHFPGFHFLASQSSVSYSYNPATLALATETITYKLPGQAPFTRIIDRSRDTLGRDTGWTLGTPTSPSAIENSATYTYSPTDGRLQTVAGASGSSSQTVAGASGSSFHYSYIPNSNLLHTITSPVHTTTNTWDPTRNVLATKENKVGSTVISSYTYNVNHLGQRTQVSKTGTAFTSARDIAWGYNNKGEVVKADSSVNNFDRAYQYDGIGNRLKSADSLTLPTSNNYTPNALNQYQSIGTLSPGYDFDGNMTSGPLPADPNANSTLAWDAENRLISTTVNAVTTTYLYDSQSRRIAQTVGTAGAAGPTILYIYDGWNPIAEYSISNNQYPISRSYTWGMDLSGSMQGAGGVGGLLAVTDSTGTYYPTFDGNGNISEYLDSTGAISAHYEYDPFGKETVSNGTKAGDIHHRFSTKPLDSTTGLYYYGYRYYDPTTGRWPSRDPIEEEGGINLYAFIGNSLIDNIDIFGLSVGDLQAMQQAAFEGSVAAFKTAEEEYLKIIKSKDPTVPYYKERFKPRSAREYGGRVCEKCTIKEDKTMEYSYYLTQNEGYWPKTDRASVYLWGAENCNSGDKLVAWWHTHPSMLIAVLIDKEQGRKPISERKYKHYWGKGDAFSGPDKDWVNEQPTHNPDKLVVFVTRRSEATSREWTYEMSAYNAGASGGEKIKESEIQQPVWFADLNP